MQRALHRPARRVFAVSRCLASPPFTTSSQPSRLVAQLPRRIQRHRARRVLPSGFRAFSNVILFAASRRAASAIFPTSSRSSNLVARLLRSGQRHRALDFLSSGFYGVSNVIGLVAYCCIASALCTLRRSSIISARLHRSGQSNGAPRVSS